MCSAMGEAMKSPLELLRYHVTGAIERGEAQPVTVIHPINGLGPGSTKGAKALATERELQRYRQRNPTTTGAKK